MPTSGTDGAGGDPGADRPAGGRSTTEIIELTGAGRPAEITRTGAAALALLTFLCGAASAVLGARHVPFLAERLSGPADDDMLHVHASWPFSACSPVALAGMPGAPAPPEYDGTARRLGTAELATLAPPVAYRQGWLLVTVAGTGPGTLRIDDVDVEVFREDEDGTPDWALFDDPLGGCGPSTRWLMDVVLADGQGELVHRGPAEVSRTDPADVHVHVSSCDRYYEFGLVIGYTVDGQARVERVGSREQPFRITGAAAPTLYSSTGSPGPDQIRPGDDRLFPPCG